MLLDHPTGQYRFIPGSDPYSRGVTAAPGYEIVHCVMDQSLPWQQGFERIDAHLRDIGRPRIALCGVELRSPAPFPMQGFKDFNQGYCRMIRSWGLWVDEHNPVARTNVAPMQEPPDAVVLHAFSITIPARGMPAPTFVLAGAGELREGVLDESHIVRRGDTSAAAMREKAVCVMDVMERRLTGLGGSWSQVTTVDVYTAYLEASQLSATVVPRLGSACRHGVRWYPARPPVVDIDFEMDMRGIRQEIIVY